MTDTAPATPSIPAGWYPNPQDAAQQRWWDGTQWTDHVSAPASAAPQGAPAYSGVEQLKAPAGTSWNTPWIWLVIALPMLGLVPLLFTDFSPTKSVTYSTNPFMNGTDPLTSLISFAVSILIAGAVVTCAYLDHRELRRRGVPQPFHWAFAFFALINLGVIYAIGRAVVVKHRTGNGGPVLAAAIVSIVLGVVLFMVYFVIAMAQVLQNMPGYY